MALDATLQLVIQELIHVRRRPALLWALGDVEGEARLALQLQVTFRLLCGLERASTGQLRNMISVYFFIYWCTYYYQY